MELLAAMVFGSLLILLSLASTIADDVKGHVLFSPEQNELFDWLYQSSHTTTEPGNNMKHSSTHHTIPLASDKNLRVKCEEYDNEAKEEDDNEAKVFIYGPEGYLVDVWRLHYSKDICKQVNKNIYLDEHEQPRQTQKDSEYDELTFTMMYKFSWENQRCLKRHYTVNTLPHIAKLDRGISTMTDCLGTPVETAEEDTESGWEGYLLSSGKYEILDFNKNMDSVGEPREFTIQAEGHLFDFKLKCQQYKKKQSSEEDSTLATGLIMYENNLVLEKLYLDTCNSGVEGIYINLVELTLMSTIKEFELVFKTKDGQCFKRFISYQTIHETDDKVSIHRKLPEEVNCPKDGDWTSNKALSVRAKNKWLRRVIKGINDRLVSQ
ncbi:uncharacterized protein LOC129000142 [Macrosteles quadrilineatus]|uniref:uncharacterized protein LOC129000142 n=1 Tax=Macrosteles quadrilineatus TaxID=74068 RepID=UPI0023E2602B|nr:uncharacterized protein LOC129000142 [Macrosteles quadrilineatus]